MTTPTPFDSLLEALDLLLTQARVYERVLPANDYSARAAVAALTRLAQRARSEALSLVDSYHTPDDTLSTPHPFSPREYEVLCLTAQGLTNKEIAYRLGISERTVQFHINSIFNKSTTSSRTEATGPPCTCRRR